MIGSFEGTAERNGAEGASRVRSARFLDENNSELKTKKNWRVIGFVHCLQETNPLRKMYLAVDVSCMVSISLPFRMVDMAPLSQQSASDNKSSTRRIRLCQLWQVSASLEESHQRYYDKARGKYKTGIDSDPMAILLAQKVIGSAFISCIHTEMVSRSIASSPLQAGVSYGYTRATRNLLRRKLSNRSLMRRHRNLPTTAPCRCYRATRDWRPTW